jgi:hypothetical protein
MTLRHVREPRVELTRGRGMPRIKREEPMRKVRRGKKRKNLEEAKEK